MAKVPVKFYFDTMPGMPQITNNYGDMVNNRQHIRHLEHCGIDN